MISLVKRNLHGFRLITVLAPISKLLEAIIELFVPLVVANIIDKGIKNNDNPYILKLGGLMLILYVSGFIFSIICQYLAAVCAFGFSTNLKDKLFSKINRLSMRQIEIFGASTLVMRLNSDCNNVQNALNRFIRLVTRAPFILIGALIMAVKISPALSLIFFAVSILIALSLFLIMRLSAPKIKKINLSADNLTQKTRENLSGSRVIRALNKQEYEETRFNSLSREFSRQSILLAALTALTNPLTYLFVNGAVIAILFFGAKQVNLGQNETGQIIALITYLSQILNALVIIAALAVLFSKAAASARRINEVLYANEENANEQGTITLDENALNAIEFKNVSYGILKNISFSLKKGQTLGIIGGTGSGKTTLISLICGLYDFNGTINLFNADINQYSHKFLRSLIAVADQKAVLISGSVRSNLALANLNASDQQMNEALIAANCDFIRSLDAHTARGGTNFSGGQRQRLSLARAIIKNPRLIIIDDGLSALDYVTERQINESLNKLNATKVIISQRLRSISSADLIIVLDDGNAVGIGTHDQLMKNCPLYQEIAQIQEESNEI